MSEHHKTKSPSSFPQLDLCPCYKSGPVGYAANRGTAQHKVLEQLLTGAKLNSDLSKDEMNGVVWAYEYVMEMAEREGILPDEIKTEQKIHICNSELQEVTFGRLDIAFLDVIFDYKSGQQRDYSPQMKAYALGYMQETGLESCNVVELYGKFEYAKTYPVTYEECFNLVEKISKSVDDPNKKPSTNKYCTWCIKKTTCSAVTGKVSEMYENLPIVGTEKKPFVKELNKLAKSDVKSLTTSDLSFLLPISRVISGWCDSIKEEAVTHLKAGKKIEGYTLKTKAGSNKISDPVKAMEKLKLTPEKFIEACSVGVGKLEGIHKEITGLTKKDAKIDLQNKLGSLMKRSNSSQSLSEE